MQRWLGRCCCMRRVDSGIGGEGEGFVVEDGWAVLVSSDLRGPSTTQFAKMRKLFRSE
jgi:hypothetical protein